MKYIWTELGKLEHESRVRQYTQHDDRAEHFPGWLVKPVIAVARLVRNQAASASEQVKSLADQPDAQPQDRRVTGEYNQAS